MQGFEKIMAIIFLILILGCVIVLIFKPDLLRWARNLPDYNEPDNTEIVVNADEAIARGLCDIPVARFKRTGSYYYASLIDNNNLIDTKLYWDDNLENGEIKLDTSGFDPVVASVKKYIIYVKPEFLTGNGGYSDMSSVDKMKLIDKSYILSVKGIADKRICKSKAQTI